MTTNQGVGEVKDVNTLVNLQISLARIEETLKPLAELVPTVAEIKNVSKEALLCAQQANQKLIELENVVYFVKETAEDAKRKAEDALAKLASQDDHRKWVRRSFYGPLISSIASFAIAAVLAYIGWSGR